MPARVAVVHDEIDFLATAVSALQLAGYEVADFTDPLAALAALEQARQIDLLITRIDFGVGKLHGIALARMARSKRPAVKVLFTALPEFAAPAAEEGEFMPMPVEVPELLAKADHLLKTKR